jgi:arsenite-transporting ATPase
MPIASGGARRDLQGGDDLLLGQSTAELNKANTAGAVDKFYNAVMRILLFSGKGGVGKTSLAAASGLKLAELGYRTMVMSIDPAHSLADAFDLETNLFHVETSDPLAIDGRLFIQEVNIQKEIKRHWQEISSYVSSVLRTTGISGVEADELAILPGMEELSAMMYINQYHREKRYDVIVLDAAPTAESMRFISMPTTLDWYMKHIFPFQRNLLKAVRPIANRVAPFELPPDTYFGNIRDLFEKLDGVDDLMEDPQITSVRLITNPEKMVLRETQRAFVYFCLHGLTVDTVVINRLLPSEVMDSWFDEWHTSQNDMVDEIQQYFAPVPVKRVHLFAHEVLGRQRLEELARVLYAEHEDPAAVTRTEKPYTFGKDNGFYEIRILLPFATKGEVELFKKGDELVVQIGTFRRHIGLPRSMAALLPSRARLENEVLRVEMKEAS